MRLFDILIDFFAYLMSRIRDLLNFVFELVLSIINKIYSKFIEVNFAEKIIFLNVIPTFFAIILPVARYYIFEKFNYISNPLAVYLIGIAIVMYATIYITGRYVFIIRIALNAYYLFWVIYLPAAEGLTQANPHEICFGYYLNIVVPVVFGLFALISQVVYHDY